MAQRRPVVWKGLVWSCLFREERMRLGLTRQDVADLSYGIFTIGGVDRAEQGLDPVMQGWHRSFLCGILGIGHDDLWAELIKFFDVLRGKKIAVTDTKREAENLNGHFIPQRKHVGCWLSAWEDEREEGPLGFDACIYYAIREHHSRTKRSIPFMWRDFRKLKLNQVQQHIKAPNKRRYNPEYKGM